VENEFAISVKNNHKSKKNNIDDLKLPNVLNSRQSAFGSIDLKINNSIEETERSKKVKLEKSERNMNTSNGRINNNKLLTSLWKTDSKFSKEDRDFLRIKNIAGSKINFNFEVNLFKIVFTYFVLNFYYLIVNLKFFIIIIIQK